MLFSDAQNVFRVSTLQAGFVTGSFELQDILFYGGCGFSIMRCMSFALENCEKKDGNYTFVDLLKYNFYLPFFYFGPVMTFDQFHVQVNNIKSKSSRLTVRLMMLYQLWPMTLISTFTLKLRLVMSLIFCSLLKSVFFISLSQELCYF